MKYATRGGIDTLQDMALNKKWTLDAMGKHFGVSREYIRQLLFLCGIRKGKRMGAVNYGVMEREGTVERRLKNLYKWIIDKNMLIGEFANESDIPSTRLSCMLTGKITPTYKDLSKIRLVTGLSFEEILTDKESSELVPNPGPTSKAPAA